MITCALWDIESRELEFYLLELDFYLIRRTLYPTVHK